MKQVFQTRYGQGTGNCFAACVASILELDLKEVPNFAFEYDEKNWFKEFKQWLYRFHCGAICIPYEDHIEEHMLGFQIGVVRTMTDGTHAIVCVNGKPAFDPAPGSGQPKEYKEIMYYVIFTATFPDMLTKGLK